MTLPRPLTHAARAEFLRYTDPDRWPVLGRFPVEPDARDALLAAMVTGAEADVETARETLADERDRTAAKLVSDATFVAQMEQLPFGPGDRVVAVGDSITADRLGWFELVAAAAGHVDAPGAEFLNLALSGSTTADALERLDLLEAAAPSHVLLMLGTNDARGHGRGHRPTMVTPAETSRNLSVLAELITGELRSDLVVLTPPSCDGARARRFFEELPLGWRESDVDAVAEAVRRLGVTCVDAHTFTRSRPAGAVFDDDGVHLSRTGQRDLARFVVGELVRRRRDRDMPSVRLDGAVAS